MKYVRTLHSRFKFSTRAEFEFVLILDMKFVFGGCWEKSVVTRSVVKILHKHIEEMQAR